MAAKTAIAQPDPDDAAAVVAAAVQGDARTGDMISEYMYDEREVDDESRTVAYRAIIAQIMSAESIDEVLMPVDADNAADFVDRHLTLNGFEFNVSEFDVGSPVYASCKVYDHVDQRKRVLNTSWQALMAQLMKLAEMDAFPVDIAIRQAKKRNRFGKFALRLVKWEENNG